MSEELGLRNDTEMMVPGARVIFLGACDEQIAWGNNNDPRPLLIVGETYTIAEQEAHSWHTKVRLRGVSGWFNSVHFEFKEANEVDSIKRMDIAEFRRLGLLQEVNRLFFHPRGLALEIVVEDGEPERLGGIWDYRDDPEGMGFADNMISPVAALYVQALFDNHLAVRQELFGMSDGIQAIPDHEPVEEETDG